jgi:hypothetical protein
VFWRVALPLFVAAAATGVYLIARPSGKPVIVQSVSKSSSTPVSLPEANTSGSANLAGKNGRVKTYRPGNNEAVSNRSTGSVSNKAARFADVSKGFEGRHDKNSDQTGAGSSSKTGELSDRDALQGAVEPTVETGRMTAPSSQKGRKAWLFQPGLADQRRTQAIGAARLTNKKGSIAIAGLQKKSRPWEAGFVAGGGVSRLNRLNSAQAPAAVATTAISFYNINGSNSSKAYISDVRSDASFSGGIYLQKGLSDRLTFNTGMMLHYYSSGITIGQQVNTYVLASASFVNPAALTPTPSATVYSAGNRQSFTNRYYFLELPLNMQLQVNKSHLLPLFLEGGFSLARLMSANALLYDSETGVYSKQGEQINKTQVYVSTAFMAGLPIHGLHIEVGPQVQYGLTPIVDNHGLGDQHFFYAGLKVVIIPGKK